MRPIIRMGPIRQISGLDVSVVCTSKTRGMAHAGVFVVSPQIWELEGRMYATPLHSCSSLEKQGCAAATQLRAVASALSIITPGATLKLFVTDHYAAEILRRWQDGDTDLPSWYTPDTDDKALLILPGLLADYPELLTVYNINLGTRRHGSLARRLASELLVATRLAPEAGGAHLDATLPPLVATLPF